MSERFTWKEGDVVMLPKKADPSKGAEQGKIPETEQKTLTQKVPPSPFRKN